MKHSPLWLKMPLYFIFALWVFTALKCHDSGGPIPTFITIWSPANIYYQGDVTYMYATFSYPGADEFMANLWDSLNRNQVYDYYGPQIFLRYASYRRSGIILFMSGYWSSSYFATSSGIPSSASLGFNVISVQGSEASDIGSSVAEVGTEPRTQEEIDAILAWLSSGGGSDGGDYLLKLQSSAGSPRHQQGLNSSVSQRSVDKLKPFQLVEFYARDIIRKHPWLKSITSKITKYGYEFGEALTSSKDLPQSLINAVRSNNQFLQSQVSAIPERFTKKQVEEFSGVLSDLQRMIDLKGRQNQVQARQWQAASAQVQNWLRALQRAEGKTLKEVVEDESPRKKDTPAFSKIRLDSYPNPFNPSNVIRYSLPTPGHVTVKVYDVTGRLVQTLVNKEQEAGDYSVQFDGTSLSSGTYLVQLGLGELIKTMKISLLK